MKLDFLFFRKSGTARARRDSVTLREPRLAGGSGARGNLPALPEPDGSLPLSTPLNPPFDSPFDPRARTRVDPRRMSPRQLAAWAHDLYLCRMLGWEEYCMAGFPAELHPHYNRTVGVLTGTLAQPDSPRNMIRVWEDKLAFTRRYFAGEAPEVHRTGKLLRLLRQLLPAAG